MVSNVSCTDGTGAELRLNGLVSASKRVDSESFNFLGLGSLMTVPPSLKVAAASTLFASPSLPPPDAPKNKKYWRQKRQGQFYCRRSRAPPSPAATMVVFPAAI